MELAEWVECWSGRSFGGVSRTEVDVLQSGWFNVVGT